MNITKTQLINIINENDFTDAKFIGQGTIGSVYRINIKNTHERIAVKIISLPNGAVHGRKADSIRDDLKSAVIKKIIVVSIT